MVQATTFTLFPPYPYADATGSSPTGFIRDSRERLRSQSIRNPLPRHPNPVLRVKDRPLRWVLALKPHKIDT